MYNQEYDYFYSYMQQQQNNMGTTSGSSGSNQSSSSIKLSPWGLGEQRAVGSPLSIGGSDEHEALSRRASQPVPTMASLVTSLLLDINPHRRLDRSQSEPAKTLVNNTSRYKTELCRPYEESGECKYGDKCQFAHGCHELRNLVRHPKYKTELCRTFHTVGFCPYGPRCHFIHNAEEARMNLQKSRPQSLRFLSTGPGSSADTPSPPSSLGSVSPPPSATANTAFSFAPIVPLLESPPPSLSPPQSPSPPPGSPDARLPVFNRLSGQIQFALRQFGEQLVA
uniref:C3H1-type domain-containing protein n=1 Tax=Clastoptera arizonana TaxID=38151 RepID=A0A1B6CWP5_9HEMI